LLGLGEQCLKYFHGFVGVANFTPFAARFDESIDFSDREGSRSETRLHRS
jgi:hypothetical protein